MNTHKLNDVHNFILYKVENYDDRIKHIDQILTIEDCDEINDNKILEVFGDKFYNLYTNWFICGGSRFQVPFTHISNNMCRK